MGSDLLKNQIASRCATRGTYWWGPFVLVVALFGCPATKENAALTAKVRLGTNFDVAAVTGLQLILDGVGDAGLNLTAMAAQEYNVQGIRYSASVSDCDADGRNEYCVSIIPSPFSSTNTNFTFNFSGNWGSSPISLRCVVTLQGDKSESVTREVDDTGAALQLVSAAAKTTTCEIPCRTGYSCKTTTSTSLTVSSTTPASPSPSLTPLVIGTADDDWTVKIYSASTCATAALLATGTGAAFKSPGIQVTVPANQTTTLFAQATDTASNVSPCVGPLSYTNDSVAPAAPSGLSVSPASPSNNLVPMLKGSAEVGSTVRIHAAAECDGGVAVQGSAAAFGDAGISLTVSANSTSTFFASAIDSAGNVSACSDGGVVYVNDTALPSLVLNASVSPVGPANNNSPVVSGTAEAASTVRIYQDSQCTGASPATTTANSDAGFSVAVSVPDNATAAFYATVTDVAGNPVACHSIVVTYTEDSTGPTFAGVGSVKGVSTSSIALSWDAAIDAVTDASAAIPYDICLSTVAGTCIATYDAGISTDAGQTSTTVTGLTQGTRYYFVVRARDQAGNRDSNSNEVSSKPASTKSVIQLAAGPDSLHTCVVLADGTAKCWGGSAVGQLGQGAGAPASTCNNLFGGTSSCYPSGFVNTELSGVAQISTGWTHSCAVLRDGTVRCWGMNDYGQLGNGSTVNSASLVTPSSMGGRAVAVAAGFYSTCALRDDGTIRCWGGNSSGLLGDGVTSHGPLCGGSDCSLVPVTVAGISDAVDVKVSGTHACAVLSTGGVRCWGGNGEGALGNDGGGAFSNSPVVVEGITDAVEVSLAWYFSCARLANGSARCWGDNNSGKLGNDGGPDSPVPVPVLDLAGAVDLSCGSNHTCATLADGTAKCWGHNQFGAVGDGTTVTRPTPVAVSNLANAASMQGSYSYSCASQWDGTVQCWGTNTYGNFGTGGTDASVTPVLSMAPLGPEGATMLAAGAGHTCARMTTGGVKCWGMNDHGQLGDGTTTNRSRPVDVAALGDVVAVGAGYAHSCAIVSDGGRVVCWGDNRDGGIGDGTATDRAVPTVVAGLGSAVTIAGGAGQSCALLGDGTVKCWGANTYGQIGNNTTGDFAAPAVVNGLANVRSIAVGGFHACALVVLDGGVPWCWGRNNAGQLGDGTDAGRSAPVAVIGVTSAKALAAGELHTCALLANGTATCWGANSDGQLGDGTQTDRWIATNVATLDAGAATGVWAGRSHTCIRRSDGTASCWGQNSRGQIGDGTTSVKLTPTLASSVANILLMATGGAFTCAIQGDGTLACWGDNAFGQLGDGTTQDRATPSAVVDIP
ncbi:MAG: hypothetical protein HYY84_10490 [Deltaproteobacteria bacterium]|nr:hypothetical protein [Deltaproteobacteria bacterium]